MCMMYYLGEVKTVCFVDSYIIAGDKKIDILIITIPIDLKQFKTRGKHNI